MHSKNLIIQLKEGARIEHIPELKPATIPSGCIRIEPLYKNPGGTGFNERERTAGLHRTYLLKFDNRTDLIEFRKHLQPSEGIEYIEEDEVNQACTEPNDPYCASFGAFVKLFVCLHGIFRKEKE